MKHLYFTFIIIITFYGCNYDVINKSKLESKTSIGPKSQLRFVSLHIKHKENSYLIKNDIQRKKYKDNFDEELNNFIDSVVVFVNWKGIIENISFDVQKNLSSINTEISYDSDSFTKVSFFTKYTFDNTTLSSDSIFNRLERIPIGSVVYFDGFISRNFKGNIQREIEDDFYEINDPNYRFNLLEISTEPRKDSLSSKLNTLIPIHFKVFKLLRKKVNKEITNKLWEKRTTELLPKGLEDNLSDDEKSYLHRLKQYLFDDFMK